MDKGTVAVLVDHRFLGKGQDLVKFRAPAPLAANSQRSAAGTRSPGRRIRRALMKSLNKDDLHAMFPSGRDEPMQPGHHLLYGGHITPARGQHTFRVTVIILHINYN
ncbi:hypothetical protein D3C73_1393840 [compost metagenome]